MGTMKIFIVVQEAEKLFTPEQLERIRAAGEVTIIETVQPLRDIPALLAGTEDRIVAIDPDSCDWSVTGEDIAAIPGLTAIVGQSTSFNWIDTARAAELGIPVVNNPGFSTVAVAEWTVSAALALARRLPLVMKDGWKLHFTAHRGMELRGRTAGVIGLGDIGTAVAEDLTGLGMDVRYWSKNSRDERFTFTELPQLMESCDVIVTAMARNAETAELVTEELLGKMRPTAMFIRTGFPSHHETLLRMVKEGRIFGYAFEDDAPASHAHDGNVWVTPHLAWLTEESIARNAAQWTEAIVAAANGDYANKVN
jgi:glycerate dehydrogenase